MVERGTLCSLKIESCWDGEPSAFGLKEDPRNSSVNHVGIHTDVKGYECKNDIRSVSMLKYAPLLWADTDAQIKCNMFVS